MKMLRKLMLAFLLLLVASATPAQTAYPFPQPGTVFCEEFVDYSSFTHYGHTYKYDGDTVYGGDTLARFCEVIVQAGPTYFCGSGNYNYYTRYDNGKVYIRTMFINATEDLYYDFNLAVGDTFNLPPWGRAIADTVSTRLCLNGQTRKYIHLKGIETWNNTSVYRWIDGIGDIDMGLLYPSFIDAGNYFICQSDASGKTWEGVYPATFDCDSMTAVAVDAVHEIALEHPRLYPNPATTSAVAVQFDYPPSAPVVCTITDAAGRVVGQSVIPAGEASYTLALPEMTQGCYFIRFTTGEKIYYQKLIRQ